MQMHLSCSESRLRLIADRLFFYNTREPYLQGNMFSRICKYNKFKFVNSKKMCEIQKCGAGPFEAQDL